MTKYKEFFLAFLLVFGIAFVGTAILYKDAQAQTQWGANNITVWLGTVSSGVQTLSVGTGASKANSDSVAGTVTIGSATSGNGFLFTLYDSATTSTSGRAVIGTFSCSAPGQFTLNQAVQYGILMVNTGCTAMFSWLTHK